MILVATIFAFLLMDLNMMHHLEIRNLLRNGEFYTSYCNFEPTVGNCLYNAFIRTFIKANNYVGPFWTIRYELFGYILCLIMCTLLKGKKYRRILYIAIEGILCIVKIDFYYLFPFVLGVYVADLLIFDKNDTTYLSRVYQELLKKKIVILCICVIGIYLATIPMSYAGIHTVLGIVPSLPTSVFRGIGVALLLYIFVTKHPFKKFLESKPIQWLGKISFPIYAFHWPLMLSLQAYLFSKFINYSDYDLAAIGAFFCNFVAVICISYLAWRLLEKTNVSNKLIKLIFHRRMSL